MALRTFLDTGSGPYRIKILVERKYYQALYSKSDWNRIQRASLIAGGTKFANDYVPLRFTPYARAFLGYVGKKRGMPLVVTGRLQEYVLANTRVSATATANNAKLIVEIPTPEMTAVQHGVRVGVARTYKANPTVNAVLSAVTDREVAVVAEVAVETMSALIEGSESHITQRGTNAGRERRSLSSAQRASIPNNARADLRSQHQQRRLAG